MEKALNSILSNDEHISSLVSGRISIMKRDESFPAITFEKTGRTQERDTTGRPIGVIQSSMQIISIAKTYKEAKTISDLIAAKLEGLNGNNFGIKILLTVQNDESSNQLLEPDITEITLDYTFYHN
jgi:hypothetical protein